MSIAKNRGGPSGEPGRSARGPVPWVALAAVGALFLPPFVSCAVLVGLLVIQLRRPAPPSGHTLAVAGLAVAAALQLVAGTSQAWKTPPAEAWRDPVAKAWRQAWEDLRAEARQAARSLPRPPVDPTAESFRLAAFEALRARTHGQDGLTLVLLDPDGEPLAWAGEGLLHEPVAADLPPSSGFAYRRGYTASTVYAVEPWGQGRRPHRVVAGRSLSASRLPVRLPALPEIGVPWSLGSEETTADEVRIDVPGVPTLRFEPPRRRPRWPEIAGAATAGAKVVLGLVLGLVAGLHLGRIRATEIRRAVVLAAAAGAAVGAGAGLPPSGVALTATAGGLAAAGLGRASSRSRRRRRHGRGWELAAGAGATLLWAGIALLARRAWAPGDLGETLGGGVDAYALRAAGALLVAGGAALGTRRVRTELAGGRDLWAWAAAALGLGAATALDLPVLGLALLAAGGACLGRWLGDVDLRRRVGALAGLFVVTSILSAAGWETASRWVVREEMTGYLALIGPPTDEELNSLHQEFLDFFEGVDVAALTPPPTGSRTDPQDLAFVLWRASPLPGTDSLSAVVVEGPDGLESSFTYGLALDQDLELHWAPLSWDLPLAEPWLAGTFGEAVLRRDGAPWGTMRFWHLPRPGFRLPVSEIEELESTLLGGRRARRPADGLPGSVHYGLYADDGRALVSPWPESPPFEPELPDEGEAVARTPSGRTFTWWRRESDGIEVLYLPALTARDALERVGTHALAGLLPLLGLLGATAVPRQGIRRLAHRVLRSYSRRLLLVYALLLLLPLVALNLVLMRAFEERLRDEQLAVAQDALDSARLFLVDFIQGSPAGFGIDTLVNRELLEWIDGVVKHPVNIYWGGLVYSSSQGELFTAGLLPRRIPGEIFSRLALLDYERGVRTQHRGDVGYREIYALLKIPGTPASMGRLFVSVPLLAQEAEVTRELAALRRRALLVTSALVVLVLAVGSRLVESFTRPLMELVAGTRRIAAGATRLGLEPRDQELSALAGAIDVMAGRIAEGRRRLLREKQVVDRMVENVTSAIVSLDQSGRVLLQNRVARELLGTEVGRPLDQALAEDPRLAPVRGALQGAGSSLERTTLRLVERGAAGTDDDEAAEEREWTVTWVPLPGSEDPAALVVVDDATEVLRGQRLEAWADMARIIAHEIKNPLTPIKLSTEHMRQVWSDDRERFGPVFERCTTNVLRQVEELREIASEFSTFSRIPQIRREPDDLVAALAEVADAYREAAAVRGAAIRFVAGVESLPFPFDRRLLRRAIRNLLENALRASREGGEVILEVSEREREVVVAVRDRGPGVPQELLPRIFEPYFSTHETGTGLGLAITRRVVEEHGGRIEARLREAGGLEMVILLPRRIEAAARG